MFRGIDMGFQFTTGLGPGARIQKDKSKDEDRLCEQSKDIYLSLNRSDRSLRICFFWWVILSM